MIDEKNKITVIWWLIFLVMAVLGSVARISHDIINNKYISFRLVVCKLIVSMFAGLLTILLCSYKGIDESLIGCMSGLSGWLGSEAISVIANRFKDK